MTLVSPDLLEGLPKEQARELALPRFSVGEDVCPYYHLVPKDPLANMLFRKEMIVRMQDDAAFAVAVWEMCKRDLLFFVNTFCWTYNPKKKGSEVLPFITWDFQDEALLDLKSAIEDGDDIGIEKSRDMGASWMCLLVFFWMWMFHGLVSFLLVSRTEDLVDKKNDPDCLFWKLDFLLQMLPSALRPKYKRTALSLMNEESGGTLIGCSTASDASRGGRKTAILLDEFGAVPDGESMNAATRDATDCRLFNSTPPSDEIKGKPFVDMIRRVHRKLRLHWTRHPEKRRGLYTSKNGVVKLLDKSRFLVRVKDTADNRRSATKMVWFPEEYPFVLDEKLRSPWYDKQCERAGSPAEIARELDINYKGAARGFFDAKMLDRYESEFSMPPFWKGELHFRWDPGGKLIVPNACFVPEMGGRLSLWCYMDAHGRAPRGKFAAAADVATGTGASNSVLAIADEVTKEKIGEFVSPYLQPYEFADQCVAICQWLGGARLEWEANGPGRNFGQQVVKRGYENIGYRRNEFSRAKKATDTPGWWSTNETKRSLLGKYAQALAQSTFINRCRESIQEARDIIYTATGVAHRKSIEGEDASGARENHGDRVIADALLWKMLDDGAPDEVEEEQEPPYMSMAWILKWGDEKRAQMSRASVFDPFRRRR